ncbi:uncharacterized protein LOC144639758 [Oculina patagonica]
MTLPNQEMATADIDDLTLIEAAAKVEQAANCQSGKTKKIKKTRRNKKKGKKEQKNKEEKKKRIKLIKKFKKINKEIKEKNKKLNKEKKEREQKISLLLRKQIRAKQMAAQLTRMAAELRSLTKNMQGVFQSLI